MQIIYTVLYSFTANDDWTFPTTAASQHLTGQMEVDSYFEAGQAQAIQCF